MIDRRWMWVLIAGVVWLGGGAVSGAPPGVNEILDWAATYDTTRAVRVTWCVQAGGGDGTYQADLEEVTLRRPRGLLRAEYRYVVREKFPEGDIAPRVMELRFLHPEIKPSLINDGVGGETFQQTQAGWTQIMEMKRAAGAPALELTRGRSWPGYVGWWILDHPDYLTRAKHEIVNETTSRVTFVDVPFAIEFRQDAACGVVVHRIDQLATDRSRASQSAAMEGYRKYEGGAGTMPSRLVLSCDLRDLPGREPGLQPAGTRHFGGVETFDHLPDEAFDLAKITGLRVGTEPPPRGEPGRVLMTPNRSPAGAPVHAVSTVGLSPVIVAGGGVLVIAGVVLLARRSAAR